MTKLTDEDRSRLTQELVDDLQGGQLIKFGTRNLYERAIERRLAEFEHTPIPTGPTWWGRVKVKLFGEVRPDGT